MFIKIVGHIREVENKNKKTGFHRAYLPTDWKNHTTNK